jgi:uncharacterized protein (DUF433 family)
MMSREEAQTRLSTAVKTLQAAGWKDHEIAALLTGLHREDRVEAIEEAARRSKKPNRARSTQKHQHA